MRHASVTVDPAALRRWYVDDRLAMAAIAIRVRCGSTTIGRRLRAAGIPVRPRGPVPGDRSGARRLPAAGEAWTAELAYAVGLIATDGNLSRDGYVLSVASNDCDLLEVLRRCLHLTNRITPYTTGRCYHIQWRDRSLYEWLVTIGLKPRKSLDLGPIAIPSAHFADFFRGCVDGDGTILVYTDVSHAAKSSTYVYERLYISIVSGSSVFVEWLRAELSRLIDAQGAIQVERRRGRHPLWRLRFAKGASIRLIQWMYYSSSVPCLRRKRMKAERFLQPLGHSPHRPAGRPRAGWLYNASVPGWCNWKTRSTQNRVPARA